MIESILLSNPERKEKTAELTKLIIENLPTRKRRRHVKCIERDICPMFYPC